MQCLSELHVHCTCALLLVHALLHKTSTAHPTAAHFVATSLRLEYLVAAQVSRHLSRASWIRLFLSSSNSGGSRVFLFEKSKKAKLRHIQKGWLYNDLCCTEFWYVFARFGRISCDCALWERPYCAQFCPKFRLKNTLDGTLWACHGISAQPCYAAFHRLAWHPLHSLCNHVSDCATLCCATSTRTLSTRKIFRRGSTEYLCCARC